MQIRAKSRYRNGAIDLDAGETITVDSPEQAERLLRDSDVLELVGGGSAPESEPETAETDEEPESGEGAMSTDDVAFVPDEAKAERAKARGRK